MKIRTDFVTNSSSSSFVVFTLKLYSGGKEICKVNWGGGNREEGESVYADIDLFELVNAHSIEDFKNILNSQIKFSQFNYFENHDDEEVIPAPIADLAYMPDTIYIDSQEEDDYGNSGQYKELIYHYATKRCMLKTEGDELVTEDGSFGYCNIFTSGVESYSLDEEGKLYYEENGEKRIIDKDYGMKPFNNSNSNSSGKIELKGTRIAIEEGTTVIEEEEYCDRSDIVEVSIPNSVVCIEDNAFSGCDRLKTIVLPDSVKEIGCSAFSCSGLESIIIPDGIKIIADGTFFNCERLKSVSIPDSVISIGEEAFDSCKSLEAIIIPKEVKRIESNTFYNCQSLKSISIPDSLEYIDEDAFGFYLEVPEVILGENSHFEIKDGRLYEKGTGAVVESLYIK